MGKRDRGFTFVEVILVTAILSVVGLVLVSVITNGLTLWERISNVVLEEDVAIFFDKFSADIRNCINFNGIDFAGTIDSFSLPSLIPMGEYGSVPGSITYFYDKGGKALKRNRATYSDLYRRVRVPDETLADGISSFRFLYYGYDQEQGAYYWTDKWSENKPVAVKIELEVIVDDKGVKYARTIDVPIGKIEPQEL